MCVSSALLWAAVLYLEEFGVSVSRDTRGNHVKGELFNAVKRSLNAQKYSNMNYFKTTTAGLQKTKQNQPIKVVLKNLDKHAK